MTQAKVVSNSKQLDRGNFSIVPFVYRPGYPIEDSFRKASGHEARGRRPYPARSPYLRILKDVGHVYLERMGHPSLLVKVIQTQLSKIYRNCLVTCADAVPPDGRRFIESAGCASSSEKLLDQNTYRTPAMSSL